MTWSFYDPETGEFSRKIYSGPDKSLAANTPKGLTAIKGKFDARYQRIDHGKVVEYASPPTLDIAAHAKRAEAIARVEALEVQQSRAVREFALGYDGAQLRLQQIDDEIAQLRNQLNG